MSRPVQTALPRTLSLVDVVALTVGVVVGASIFRTPSLVASATGSPTAALLAWGAGGVVSIIGALCYAELASAYPHAGGDYHYFQRAFGEGVAFLFAWARLGVIQTGSIALLAFIFGDYASELWSLGPYSSSIYAASAVLGLTLLNVAGVRLGKATQQILTLTTIMGLLVLVGVGFFLVPDGAATTVSGGGDSSGQGQFGMAMVFVLLTFGGWNEAAFVSAELEAVKRNMVRSLLASLGLITVLYLLVNGAFLYGLGLGGLRASDAVAANLMRAAMGEPGAVGLSLLVAITALSSANATIFTGARTTFALGQDHGLFSRLGEWKPDAQTPANALWVQGAVALVLVGVGAWTREGFESMVDYTAPVFWLFFLGTGLSLFVLRRTEPEVDRPFRVPLYPLLPVLFCLAATYMLWSSVTFTGVGALLGLGVLATGGPVLWLQRRTA